MNNLKKVNCENCNVEFERHISSLKRAKQIFCSKKCYGAKKASENSVNVFCSRCKKEYLIRSSSVRKVDNFCSKECFKGKVKTNCYTCKAEIERSINEKNKNGQFCSRACYYKVIVSFGFTKRSKFEIYVEDKLKEDFPLLDFKYNSTETLGQVELDVYLPELKLGIEINGPHHYESFFGKSKLKKMQGRDKFKRKLCYEKGIDLFVLNISNMKQKEYELFYEEIKNKVSKKLSII